MQTDRPFRMSQTLIFDDFADGVATRVTCQNRVFGSDEVEIANNVTFQRESFGDGFDYHPRVGDGVLDVR